jgi:hypothetical protein
MDFCAFGYFEQRILFTFVQFDDKIAVGATCSRPPDFAD